MGQYLILKLEGPMQAWGGHTYEDHRPTELFPTRSGLVGLLAACLGIDRADSESQQALSDSFRYAVRSDAGREVAGTTVRKTVMTDFHTIMDARKVDGKANKYPVVSRRDYLCDASFTVAMEFVDGARFGRKQLQEAVEKPRYTPSLGRRSCPLGRPVFEDVVEASSALEALSNVEPGRGTVYSEFPAERATVLRVRDVPSFGERRRFLTREVHVHGEEEEHVPEQG
ncbi:MAG: type I-E CRISPR-associated protein Cas5/CasD [Polyangia bacterium]